jgi:hypothetical protein
VDALGKVENREKVLPASDGKKNEKSSDTANLGPPQINSPGSAAAITLLS